MQKSAKQASKGKFKLTLKETYTTQRPIDEVLAVLEAITSDEFKVEKVSARSFKCLANFSLGTVLVNNRAGVVNGIKVYVHLEENEQHTVLILKTHIRIELYFVLLHWFVFLIVSFANLNEFPFWVHIIFPPIVVLIWLLYRVHENRLLKKIEHHLKHVL